MTQSNPNLAITETVLSDLSATYIDVPLQIDADFRLLVNHDVKPTHDVQFILESSEYDSISVRFNGRTPFSATSFQLTKGRSVTQALLEDADGQYQLYAASSSTSTPSILLVDGLLIHVASEGILRNPKYTFIDGTNSNGGPVRVIYSCSIPRALESSTASGLRLSIANIHRAQYLRVTGPNGYYHEIKPNSCPTTSSSGPETICTPLPNATIPIAVELVPGPCKIDDENGGTEEIHIFTEPG